MTRGLARQKVAQLLMFGPWRERFMPAGEFTLMVDAIIARLMPELFEEAVGKSVEPND